MFVESMYSMLPMNSFLFGLFTNASRMAIFYITRNRRAKRTRESTVIQHQIEHTGEKEKEKMELKQGRHSYFFGYHTVNANVSFHALPIWFTIMRLGLRLHTHTRAIYSLHAGPIEYRTLHVSQIECERVCFCCKYICLELK